MHGSNKIFFFENGFSSIYYHRMPNHSLVYSARYKTLIAMLASCAGLASVAHADLLLDPSSGTVRLSAQVGDSNKDDGVYGSSHPTDGQFFGTYTLFPFATVSVNGHLLFGPGDGVGDWFLQPLGNNYISRVAPLWGDFVLGANGRIVEEVGSGYYVVTWLDMENIYAPGATATFQAIIVEQNSQLRGIDFLAGDIIFSYGDISLYSAMPELIIGLENELGSFAALPGHGLYGGVHSQDLFGDFPVGDNEYVLFRPDGAGNYDVSIEAVPEPSTYAAIAGLLCLAAAGVCRRRQRKQAVNALAAA